MRHFNVTLWASAAVLASMSVGGCSSDLPSSSSSEILQSQPELTAAAKDRMLERLGRGLARALKDPAVREWVSREIASSPYVEYRVPLRDKVLNESNRPELRTIGRAAALSEIEVASLRTFPHLELYLPLKDQRESWRGSADIQVAVRRSSEDHMLFQTDGSKTLVPEDHIPAKPTLVLAVSEIDYTDRESALRGGRNTGDGMLARQSFAPSSQRPKFPVLSATMPPDGSQWTRSYAHYIYDNHDGGLAGDDEMEIFGYLPPFNECRRYTGLKQNVQYFRSYPTTVIGIAEAIATAIPTNTSNPLLVEAWEDDSGACVVTASDDEYGYLVVPRANYNRQWDLGFLSTPGASPDARLGVTEYVNGQPDPTP